jgi:hypothetical protein
VDCKNSPAMYGADAKQRLSASAAGGGGMGGRAGAGAAAGGVSGAGNMNMLTGLDGRTNM